MITSKPHKGQVALVLVLIMTVVSALAVSLASRSTVDTRIQQTESVSVQALLLAQTGLEQLIMDPNAPSVGSQDSDYYAVKTSVGSSGFEVSQAEVGSTVEVNLVGATNLTGISVSWRPDTGNPTGQPAVFISLVESSGKITDYAFDYNAQNGFVAATAGSGGYSKTTGTIPVTALIRKVRITVLGSPAQLKILPIGTNPLFPSQIVSIKSIGSVNSESEAVKYGLQYDESATNNVPTVFDYALFSGGSIVQ